MAINSTLYCVYIEENKSSLPAHCCTLTLTPLLRELIFRVAQLPRDYFEDSRESRLTQVLSDELSVTPVGNRHISLPDNIRLRHLAENLIKNPADRRNIAYWARQVGMSERTLTRFMQREIGLTFGQWRSQLNILMAVEQLLSGSSVQNVALDLGYDSVSAFISMFKKVLGKSPGRYLSDLRRDDPDSLDSEQRM
jgi:AraC-like DNA-binding protein